MGVIGWSLDHDTNSGKRPAARIDDSSPKCSDSGEVKRDLGSTVDVAEVDLPLLRARPSHYPASRETHQSNRSRFTRQPREHRATGDIRHTLHDDGIRRDAEEAGMKLDLNSLDGAIVLVDYPRGDRRTFTEINIAVDDFARRRVDGSSALETGVASDDVDPTISARHP